MQLLTITANTTFIDDACISQGGLVDRQTAAAECVILWTDMATPPQPAALSPPAAPRACSASG